MIPVKNTTVVLLLTLACFFMLRQGTDVNAVPIKQSLASFPHQIGNWSFTGSSQSSADVIKMLGVDDDIQYTYVNKKGQQINLYVGYYSAVGVSGAYHSPKNCLPGGGWGIDQVQNYPLDIGIEGNDNSTISEMIIRNGSRYQVVLYWYQNRGRIIASEYWEKIYLVSDALRLGRRDGTFVRIMLHADANNIEQVSEEAGEFAKLVMTTLESYLPGRKL